MTISEPRRVCEPAGFYSFIGVIYETLRVTPEGAIDAAPAAADDLFLGEYYFFNWSILFC